MRSLVICAGITAPASGVQAKVLAPEGPLAIAPTEAAKLFKQCSRGAPSPEGDLWFPSRAEIRELETSLVKYLGQIELDTGRAPSSKMQYRGQHVGFVRGNFAARRV